MSSNSTNILRFRRTTSIAAGILAIGVATAAFAQGTPPATPAAGDAAIAPAYFTAEQAERGAASYDQRCSACHGDDIAHAVMNYPDAGQFFAFISTEMPASAPGSLQPQVYADIIAYLLSVNGFAAGATELLPDPAVLETVVIKAPATP